MIFWRVTSFFFSGSALCHLLMTVHLLGIAPLGKSLFPSQAVGPAVMAALMMLASILCLTISIAFRKKNA